MTPTFKPKNTTKTLTMVGAGLLITLATVGTVAYASPMGENYRGNSEVQAAIENNDYEGFKSAVNTHVTERANSITEEEFDQLVVRHEERNAVKAAIEADDYEAFKAVAGERMLQHVTTEEEFSELVQRHQQMETNQAALEEAVKNNDFEAYKAVLEQQKSQIDDSRPGRERMLAKFDELTDEELKAQFDEVVEYYTENGQLPNRPGMAGFGPKGHEGMREGRKGNR